MLSKRRFIGCALCAATALVAEPASAQQPPGFTRRELKRMEYSDNIVIVQMLVDIPAGAEIAKHTHPGVESSMILEGELTVEIVGQPAQTLKKGDTFQVPPGAVHGARAGANDCKAFAHLVVEKGKPLASPA